MNALEIIKNLFNTTKMNWHMEDYHMNLLLLTLEDLQKEFSLQDRLVHWDLFS